MSNTIRGQTREPSPAVTSFGLFLFPFSFVFFLVFWVFLVNKLFPKKFQKDRRLLFCQKGQEDKLFRISVTLGKILEKLVKIIKDKNKLINVRALVLSFDKPDISVSLHPTTKFYT